MISSMRLHRSCYFLTLVLLISLRTLAAPNNDSPPKEISTSPKDESRQEDLLLPTQNLSHVSTSFLIGTWQGFFADTETSTATTAAIERTYYHSEDDAWAFRFELLQTGFMGASFARRWIFTAHEYNEPYVSVGAGAIWKPEEGLGTLINIYRYRMRVSFGLEDLFAAKRRWKTEVGLAWGLNGVSYNFGLAFAL